MPELSPNAFRSASLDGFEPMDVSVGIPLLANRISLNKTSSKKDAKSRLHISVPVSRDRVTILRQDPNPLLIDYYPEGSELIPTPVFSVPVPMLILMQSGVYWEPTGSVAAAIASQEGLENFLDTIAENALFAAIDPDPKYHDCGPLPDPYQVQ